jgi:hypothetical protein
MHHLSGRDSSAWTQCLDGVRQIGFYKPRPANTNYLPRWLWGLRHVQPAVYSRITSTKSRHFAWQPSLRVSQTLRSCYLKSRDCSCYASRPILTPPQLWLQKLTDLRAHDFAHSPKLWHQPKLANVTCAWTWRLCVIIPAILGMLIWNWLESRMFVHNTLFNDVLCRTACPHN